MTFDKSSSTDRPRWFDLTDNRITMPVSLYIELSTCSGSSEVYENDINKFWAMLRTHRDRRFTGNYFIYVLDYVVAEQAAKLLYRIMCY
jgi:hypothetical protein